MDLLWDAVKEPRVLLVLVGVPVVVTASFGWAWVRHRFLLRQVAPLGLLFNPETVEWRQDWLGITSQVSGSFFGREAVIRVEVARIFSVSVGATCAHGPEVVLGRLSIFGQLNRLLNRGISFRLPEVGRFWVGGPDRDAFVREVRGAPELQHRLQKLFAGSAPKFLGLERCQVVACYNKKAKRLLNPRTMALALGEVTELATALDSRAWEWTDASNPPVERAADAAAHRQNRWAAPRQRGKP